MFVWSLEANDLLSGQSDELVEVKLDVLPPVASVSAIRLSRVTRAAWMTHLHTRYKLVLNLGTDAHLQLINALGHR